MLHTKTKQKKNQGMHFTEEERSSYLDLRPYLNPTPYTVPMVIICNTVVDAKALCNSQPLSRR